MSEEQTKVELTKWQKLVGAAIGFYGIREMFEKLEVVKDQNQDKINQERSHEITKIKNVLGLGLYNIAKTTRLLYPVLKIVEPIFNHKKIKVQQA